MRICSWRSMCAAAVAVALAVPTMAQESQREDTTAQPRAGAQQESTLQPGQTVRPGAPPAGVIIEEERREVQPGTRTANYPPGQRQAQQGQIDDAALAKYIAAGNEAEVRVNEFARQQAESDQVKQFAEKMVQEHTKFGQQLAQAAGNQSGQRGAATRSRAQERTARRNISDPNDSNARQQDDEQRANQQRSDQADQDRQSQRQDRQRQDDQPGQDEARQDLPGQDRATTRTTRRIAPGGAQAGNNPFVELHAQIKEQCAQSAIQALREKQGEEFDHAFMHGQVMAHMEMLDTLKVAQQQASGQLKQTLQQGQQATQQHLQEAKQILAQLENQRQQR